MLKVEHITTGYGKKQVLTDVSFEVKQGEIVLLTDMKKRTPFHMSGGEKQLLAFGNILVHFPKLILLDEPLSGLDDNNTIILSNAIETINKYRVSFVIVEHSSKVINNLNSIVLKLELGTINNKI